MAIHPEHRLVFTPQGKGQPQYEEIKKTTNGALMRTTGEKTQSLVAHLKVPADATDPAADLRDQLENVLKALPQQGKSPIPKGRRLLSNDGVEVRQNAKGFLEIGVKIDLRENVDYMKKFYEIMTSSTGRTTSSGACCRRAGRMPSRSTSQGSGSRATTASSSS